MEQTKTIPDLVIVKHQDAKTSEPETGLKRRVLAYNERLFLAEHELAKGWVGTVHSHPHDQIVYVVHGHFTVTCQEKTFEVRTGDTFVVRGGGGTWRIRPRRVASYRRLHSMARGLSRLNSV